jgi:hypothetical protein
MSGKTNRRAHLSMEIMRGLRLKLTTWVDGVSNGGLSIADDCGSKGRVLDTGICLSTWKRSTRS